MKVLNVCVSLLGKGYTIPPKELNCYLLIMYVTLGAFVEQRLFKERFIYFYNIFLTQCLAHIAIFIKALSKGR